MAMVQPRSLLISQQYFTDKRTIAHGLSLTGITLGSMLLPPVINYLVNTYSTSGAFLLWAGILLHGMIGGLLMHPVSWHLKAVPASTDELSNGQRKGNTSMVGKGVGVDHDNNPSHLNSNPGVSVSLPEFLEEREDTPGDNNPASSHTSATLGEKENQSYFKFLKRNGRKYMMVPSTDNKEGGQEHCSTEAQSSEVEDSDNLSTAAELTNDTTKRDECRKENKDEEKLKSLRDDSTEGTNKCVPTEGTTNNRLHNNSDDPQNLRYQTNEKKRSNTSTHRKSTRSLDDALNLSDSALSIEIFARKEDKQPKSDSEGSGESDDVKDPLVLCGIKFPRMQQVFNFSILSHPIFLIAASASICARLVNREHF